FRDSSSFPAQSVRAASLPAFSALRGARVPNTMRSVKLRMFCRRPRRGALPSPSPPRLGLAEAPGTRLPDRVLRPPLFPHCGREMVHMPETTASAYFLAHQRAQNDLAQLQGAWASIAGRRQAELLIAGNLFTIKFLDGAIYMGTFEIDPSESPPAMDMRSDEGPIKHKRRIIL